MAGCSVSRHSFHGADHSCCRRRSRPAPPAGSGDHALGMHVVTAPGGGPALDLIGGPRGEQINLVLLDLVMPDMGGLDVLAKLRPAHPELPVIVLTAKGGASIRRSRRCGPAQRFPGQAGLARAHRDLDPQPAQDRHADRRGEAAQEEDREPPHLRRSHRHLARDAPGLPPRHARGASPTSRS
ncbi:MAG: response regulator [Rhizomicrobium sp.]